MNKVVKHHIPVERLPEELRRGFAAGEIVEVEVRGPASHEGGSAPDDEEITLEAWLRQVDEEEPRRPPLPPEEIERRGALFDRFFGSHAHLNTSIEEAVERIRALRDEDD
ncbi:hypothetical protein [Salinarimonas ramus]|uniref:Uncharacterized protein n=1 Tax=Salinarimonas ramus TaxID=690164 RepID=A0A917QC15_9HYPH|nr:hypothetical protein [Salinarimonas ramus]GGK39882.1 hypothetical protein GCM10011322_28780 [Salinarimonas ramus]